ERLFATIENTINGFLGKMNFLPDSFKQILSAGLNPLKVHGMIMDRARKDFARAMSVFESAVEWIQGIFDWVVDSFSNIFNFGGGGGFLGKIGLAAKGAVIPPGYPNDNFLAGLKTDEMVLPPDL